MNAPIVKLLLITAAALVFRLALLSLVQNPGISDPAHYYNLGRRLAEGSGITIDYVWHYARMPVDLVHATDHWMPLPGVAAALGLVAGGTNIHAAVTLFVLAGSLMTALVFAASKLLGQSTSCALIGAAFAAVMPEFVLNSLRTDTTIINQFLVVAAVIALYGAMRSGQRRGFLFCGVLFGLAHLTRNDAIILFALLIACFLLADASGSAIARRSRIALLIVAFVAVIAPWHARNLVEIGTLGSPQMSRMPFMVEPRDLYAYGMPITFESMLARQSLVDIVGKRIFEFGAAIKQMAYSLQLPLVVLVPAGAYFLRAKANSRQIRLLLPLAIWLLGLLVVYPVLMPVHNQGGSFKKIFLAIMPLLLPLGAFALENVFRQRHWRYSFLALSLCWLAWSSYDLVRRDTAFADTFYASIQVLVDELETLPDRTGDGELRLMSQNPYVLSFFGYSSVVTPVASREDTLALARLYAIDYLQMPADRPALDPLYLGVESDPRFQLAARLDDAGEVPFELYGFVHDAES